MQVKSYLNPANMAPEIITAGDCNANDFSVAHASTSHVNTKSSLILSLISHVTDIAFHGLCAYGLVIYQRQCKPGKYAHPDFLSNVNFIISPLPGTCVFTGGGSLSFPQRLRSLLVSSQGCDKHCHAYQHNPTWSTTVLGEPSPKQLRPLARLREPLRPMRRSLPRTGENCVSRGACTVGTTMVKTWSAVATAHHGCTQTA